MRGNRKFRQELDNRAQVGIGTMIVFIATVLVAAIAAGVLIATSGKLQERSSRTGQEATNQVSSNLDIVSIVGNRTLVSDLGLQNLYIYIMLSPGAQDVDLGELRIQLQNANSSLLFNYTSDDGSPPAERFNATAIRDADTSFSASNPVMNAGDLVKVRIDLVANSIAYEPREHVLATLMPEVGNKIVAGFNTPPSYGTNLFIDLR